MQKSKKNQWKMAFPNIWHLVDHRGKVLAKVFRSMFRRNRPWTVWMPTILDSQHHRSIREAGRGAEKVWT